jgi:xanthine/uracil permease
VRIRPRADLAIAPVYLLTFLAFTAMVVPVATTWVRHDVDAIPAVLILAGEVLVLRLIATESERLPRMIPLVAAGIVNALLMVFVAMSVQMWLLDGGRAQEIRATVGILAALCLAAVWPSRTRKDLNLSRDPS